MRRVVKKDVNSELSKAQKSKACLICGEGGRTIGMMGTIELNYCGHHRKYGERALNFLINSVFQYQLTDFLKETKQDLFMNNMPELCAPCYDKLAKYVDRKVCDLDEVKEWHRKSKK